MHLTLLPSSIASTQRRGGNDHYGDEDITIWGEHTVMNPLE